MCNVPFCRFGVYNKLSGDIVRMDNAIVAAANGNV